MELSEMCPNLPTAVSQSNGCTATHFALNLRIRYIFISCH